MSGRAAFPMVLVCGFSVANPGRLGKRPGFKRDFTGHGGGHGGRDHGEGRHHREQRGHHADDGLYPPFDGGFSAEHDGNRGDRVLHTATT